MEKRIWVKIVLPSGGFLLTGFKPRYLNSIFLFGIRCWCRKTHSFTQFLCSSLYWKHSTVLWWQTIWHSYSQTKNSPICTPYSVVDCIEPDHDWMLVKKNVCGMLQHHQHIDNISSITVQLISMVQPSHWPVRSMTLTMVCYLVQTCPLMLTGQGMLLRTSDKFLTFLLQHRQSTVLLFKKSITVTHFLQFNQSLIVCNKCSMLQPDLPMELWDLTTSLDTRREKL